MNYYSKYLIYKYKYYSLLNLQKGGNLTNKIEFDDLISKINYKLFNSKYKILFLSGKFFYMFNEIHMHPLALNSNISTNKIIKIKKFKFIINDLINKLENQNKCMWCIGNDLKYPSFYLNHYICLLIINELLKLCNYSHIYIEEMDWSNFFPEFKELKDIKFIKYSKIPNFKDKILNINNEKSPLIIIDCGSTKTKINLNINHDDYNKKLDYFNQNEIILLPLNNIEHESKINIDKFLNLCKNLLDNKYSGILFSTAGIRNYILSDKNVNQVYINIFLEKLNKLNINSYIIDENTEAYLEWNACYKIIKHKLNKNKFEIIMCSMGGNSIQFSNGIINKSYNIGSIFFVKNCINIVNELINDKYKCDKKYLNITNNKISNNITNIINDMIDNFRFVCA